MPFWGGKPGFGLVEVIVGIGCFILALIPLLNLFSITMDSVSVIQARSQASTIAQELLSQAVLAGPERLTAGTFGFADAAGTDRPAFAAGWVLSPLPPLFSRRLVVAPAPQGAPFLWQLQVTVEHSRIPQAAISLYRTAIPVTTRETP